jgi:hypothetical protein
MPMRLFLRSAPEAWRSTNESASIWRSATRRFTGSHATIAGSIETTLVSMIAG